MKWRLTSCAALLLTGVSCEKHDLLKNEDAALDASIQQQQTAIEKLDAKILSSGGHAGVERLRLRLEPLRARTTALEQENDTRAKKWAAIEEKFSKLKPAAEAFKAAQPH